jgi:hypothetical protein
MQREGGSMIAAVSLLLSGVLLGSMIFFSAVVAPTVFSALPSEHAGSYLRALFPRYYLWGAVVAALAGAAAVTTTAAAAAALGAVALAFVAVRQGLVPAINSARDAARTGDLAAGVQFKRLHAMSVAVNLAQMVVTAIAFVQILGRL